MNIPSPLLSPEENLRLRESAAALCVYTLVQAMERHKHDIYINNDQDKTGVNEDAAAAASSASPSSDPLKPKRLTRKAVPLVRLIIRLCVKWPPCASSSSSEKMQTSGAALVDALNNANINQTTSNSNNKSNTTKNESSSPSSAANFTSMNSASMVASELFRETSNVLESALGISKDSPRESIASNVERALQDLSFFTQLCSGELLYNWVIKSLCDAENNINDSDTDMKNNNNNNATNIDDDSSNNQNDDGEHEHAFYDPNDEIRAEAQEAGRQAEAERQRQRTSNTLGGTNHHSVPTSDVNSQVADDNEDGDDSAPPRRTRNTTIREESTSTSTSSSSSEASSAGENNNNDSESRTRTQTTTRPSARPSSSAAASNPRVSLSQARLSFLNRQQQLFVANHASYHFSERSVGVVAPLALHLRSEWEKMAAAGLSIIASCAAGSSTSSVGGLGGEAIVAMRLQKLAGLPMIGWANFVDQAFGAVSSSSTGMNNLRNTSTHQRKTHHQHQHHSQQQQQQQNVDAAAAGTRRSPISPTNSQHNHLSSATAILLHSTDQANLWRALHLIPTAAELDRAHSAATSHSIESLSPFSAGTRLLGGGAGLSSLSSSASTNFMMGGVNVAERRRVHYHAALCALARARKAILRGERAIARQCVTVAASQHAPSSGLLNQDVLLASLTMKMHVEFWCGCSRDACQTIGVILDACVDSMRQSKNQTQGPPVLRGTNSNTSALTHLLMAVTAVAEALVFTPQAVDESLLRRLLFVLSCLFTKEGIEASSWISSASSSSSGAAASQSNSSNKHDDDSELGRGATDASDFVDPILTRFVSEPTTTSSSSSATLNPIILRLAWRRLLHYADALVTHIISCASSSNINFNSNNKTTKTSSSSSWNDPDSIEYSMVESLMCLNLVAASRFHDTKHATKILHFQRSKISNLTNTIHQTRQVSPSTPLSSFICRPKLATALLLDELQHYGALSALRLFKHKLSNVLLVDQTAPHTWIGLQRTIVLLCSSVLGDLGYSKAAASWIRSTLEGYASDGSSRRDIHLHSSHSTTTSSGNDNGIEDDASGIPYYLSPFLTATSSSSLPLISTIRASGGDLQSSSLWGTDSEILARLCHRLAKILTFSLQAPEQIEALCLDPLRQQLVGVSNINRNNNDSSSSPAATGSSQHQQNSSNTSSSSASIDIASSIDHIRALYLHTAVGRPSLALSSLEHVAKSFLALGFDLRAAEVLADCYIVAASHGDAESARKYRTSSLNAESNNNTIKLRGPSSSFLSKISAKKMAEVLLAGTLCSFSNQEETEEDSDSEVVELFRDARATAHSIFDEACVAIIRPSVLGKQSLFFKNKTEIFDKVSDKNVFKGLSRRIMEEEGKDNNNKNELGHHHHEEYRSEDDSSTATDLDFSRHISAEILPLAESLSWLSILLMSVKKQLLVRKTSSPSAVSQKSFIEKEIIGSVFGGLNLESISDDDEDLNEIEELYFNHLYEEVMEKRRDASSIKNKTSSSVVINLDAVVQHPMINQVNTVLDLV